MKFFQVFALFILFGLMSSCQKDQMTETNESSDSVMSSQAPPQPTKLLREMINYDNNDFVRYTFNSNDEVIQEENEESLVTIVKNGSTVTVKDSNTMEKRVTWLFTGQLDAQGRLVSGSSVNTPFASLPPYYDAHTYTYNKAGYMIQRSINRNNGQTLFDFYYSYQNGNMTRMDVMRNGVSYYSTVRTFSNIPDKNKINNDRFMVKNNFTGKTNTHLPTTVAGLDAAGKVSWTCTLTYNMDPDGYPTRVEQTYSNGNVWVFHYNY